LKSKLEAFFDSDILHTSDLASIAGNIAETFKQVLSAAGIAASVIKFLYGKYQKLYVNNLYTKISIKQL